MSPSPLIERIASELESRIISGAYRPGRQLPSESDLCVELGVSRPTLRDAVARLEALGFVRRERGRGTYVTDGGGKAVTTLLEANLSVTEMIHAMGMTAGTKNVTAGFESPAAEVVRALGLDAREAVFAVRRVRTANDEPAVLSIDFLPLWITGLPTDANDYYGSLYTLLEECCGEPVRGALARIEPVTATAEIATRFGIAEGKLLLALHQTHELASGKRVLCSTDYLRDDVFTIYVRRVLDRPTLKVEPAADGDRPSNPTRRGGNA